MKAESGGVWKPVPDCHPYPAISTATACRACSGVVVRGNRSYYRADGLGSVTSLSNQPGSLAQTYTLDSFGSQIASSGSLRAPSDMLGANSTLKPACILLLQSDGIRQQRQHADKDHVRRYDYICVGFRKPADFSKTSGLGGSSPRAMKEKRRGTLNLRPSSVTVPDQAFAMQLSRCERRSHRHC